MQPDLDAISGALSAAGVAVDIEEVTPFGEYLRVDAADAKRAVRSLREDHGFDYFVDLFGIDTGEGIDIVVMLRRYDEDVDLLLKAAFGYDGSVWESIWEDFPAALMPEREACEMFGLKLAGHPNPKRLLTTDEVLYPLRKSKPLRTMEEVRDR